MWAAMPPLEQRTARSPACTAPRKSPRVKVTSATPSGREIVLAFRGPASLLTQTDLSRLKPEDRDTAAKVAAKLKQLHSAPGIERMDQCSIAMRGQKVDKAQVSPDVTIVENGWITLVGYQAKGYAYIAP